MVRICKEINFFILIVKVGSDILGLGPYYVLCKMQSVSYIFPPVKNVNHTMNHKMCLNFCNVQRCVVVYESTDKFR